MTTVIVPVYNGEATIEACLRSIQGQTERDLEILLIDDGSVDRTASLCRRIAAEDGRIRLLHQGNAGVSAARNRGLAMARGEFVTFVDADDLLPPAAVETMEKAARAGADFVIGSYELFRGPWRRKRIYDPGDGLVYLMSLMCGKLYRRARLEENHIRFREGLPYGEDTVFNLQYAQCARSRAVLPDIVYLCRRGGAASSVRYYPDRDQIACTLIDAYCAYYGGKERMPPAVWKQVVDNERMETVCHYLVHCNPKEAREKIREALEKLPGSPKETEVLREVVRRRWVRILLRKLKKFGRPV